MSIKTNIKTAEEFLDSYILSKFIDEGTGLKITDYHLNLTRAELTFIMEEYAKIKIFNEQNERVKQCKNIPSS